MRMYVSLRVRSSASNSGVYDTSDKGDNNGGKIVIDVQAEVGVEAIRAVCACKWYAAGGG